MAGKRVGVLIRRSPLKQVEAAEALRMALGLTLRDDDIYVFLVDDALEIFLKTDLQNSVREDVYRPIETLIELKQTVIMEKESVERSEDLDYPDAFESWARDKIMRFLAECDVTIVV
jgi:sulfur relay (sulfurtransferase) DsrF/TusC family protein